MWPGGAAHATARPPGRIGGTTMAETAAPPARPDERLIRVGPLARLLTRPDIGALLGTIAVFFAFGYFARSVDWLGDPSIAAGWTDQAAQYGIVAVPVALLMIGGEFDLSAGVMIGSSGLLLGYLATNVGMNIWPAMALVMVFGLTIGFINGITVIKTRLPSFIVTLATFFVLQGVNAAGTLRLTGTTAIQNIDTASGFDSARRIFASELTHYDFKVKVLWWIGITVVGAWLLAKSRFGNWIYSAGGEPTAAHNVGVPVARTKITLFMMTSGVAALMGIIEAIELRSMQAKEGIGLEFIFIICAVVGGCLLTGGYGSVIGTFFGAAMLGMVQLGIIFSQWDSNWTYTFQGGILFAAVMLNTIVRSRAQKAR
jgi:simple sugar transport system permease protein